MRIWSLSKRTFAELSGPVAIPWYLERGNQGWLEGALELQNVLAWVGPSPEVTIHVAGYRSR